MGFEPTIHCWTSDFESDRWPIRLPSKNRSDRKCVKLTHIMGVGSLGTVTVVDIRSLPLKFYELQPGPTSFRVRRRAAIMPVEPVGAGPPTAASVAS